MSTLTYVEKLENYFHPNFLSMQVNQDSKKYNFISYIRMLEEMCKDRGIEIKREPFPVTNNFIYIQDQFGNEKRWTIEEETDLGYKIFHYEMVSMVAKNKVYRDSDGKLRYVGSIYVAEDVSRFSLSYIEDMYLGGLI